MKKTKILILILFMIMLVPNVYAASTVKEVADIKKTPLLSGKKYVYINNMKDYTITINDNDNFRVFTNNGTSNVAIYNLPTASKTYNNPYDIYWDKIGYYVDDNGNPVYLDARLKVNKIELKWVEDVSRIAYPYYLVARVNKNNYSLYNAGLDSDYSAYGNTHTGNHDTVTITLYNDDGSELDSSIADSLFLKWIVADLDLGDRTFSRGEREYIHDGNPTEHSESMQFNAGFDNNFYVLKDSLLRISNNNTKFSATEETGDENQKSIDYSTVVSYQVSSQANFEWWGSDCGTTIAAITNQYPYPTLHEPTKAVEGDIYKVGERVNYTITESFPYTDSNSKAKSIELTDTFDKALKIDGITYQVFDANDKDVTSDWEKNVSGQTVSLKYIGEDTTSVYGEFTFKFNNLIVLDPDSSHEVKKENGIEYKIIPNKAEVTIVGANDDTSTKETNIVKIRVGEIDNPDTGMNYDLIIGIIMIIIVGSISIYCCTEKKKIHL